MEEIVDKVIKKFNDAEDSLQAVENKLDAFDNNKSLKDNSDNNKSLTEEFRSIQREFISVQKEALELNKLQKEALVEFNANILQTVQQAQLLSQPQLLSQNGQNSVEYLMKSLKQQVEMMEKLSEKI